MQIRNSRIIALFFILFLSGMLFTPVLAQTSAQTSAQDRAAALRSQVAEVPLKEAELQTRLKQLDDDLKPENIEHSLAGIGSTHPEELREQRRRKLEREKSYVQAQLNELAASRIRLEAAIAQADAEIYRQNAGPARISVPTQSSTQANSPGVSKTNATPRARHRVVKRKHPRRPG
jgi:uncharacterized protein YlxW (UPF0749 family)